MNKNFPAPDFTTSSYKVMLTELLEFGYEFKEFSAAKGLLRTGRPFVLLRHDIDICLEKALAMAKIESELGIKSTYFFMVRNDFYNIFAGKGTKLLNKIRDLGHFAGLHFDCAAYSNLTTDAEVASSCNREVEIFESWFNWHPQIISFHRPSPEILKGSSALTSPYDHTYMPIFTKDIHYCSDSRGQWKFGHPLDLEAVKNRKPLHLLIHPVWWNTHQISPLENLLNHIDMAQAAYKKALAINCQVFK